MQNQALNELLRRWLRGETRASEESRLERAAKEDPFLADAWEGYHQTPEAKHPELINRLNEKIAARTSRPNARIYPLATWLPRLAVVATILLFLTLSWRWWYNEPQSTDLTINVPNLDPATSTAPDKKDTTPEVAALPEGEAKFIPAPSSKDVSPEPEAEAALADEVIAVTPTLDKEIQAMDTVKEIKSRAIQENSSAGSIPEPPGNAANLKPAAPAADLSNSQNRLTPQQPTVGGIVLDERGQRAAGIPVQRDANTFAITNQDGAFELPAAKPAEVKVIADDFETQSLRLDDNNEKVVLQRKTQTQKKSFDASDRRDGVGYPSPEGGFEKFEQYIRDNLETPNEARRHMISGTVTLEFTFDKEGKPTRFSVLRSLGFGCDQEAEHLIENGPKWRNVKPGIWVIYKVVFK